MKVVMVVALALVVAAVCLLSGCSTAPKKQSDREALSARVDGSLAAFKKEDASLDGMLQKAYGYAVIPEIGKAGLVVGGSYGRGEMFEGGKKVGFCDIAEGTVGLQIGAQTFDEILVFQNKEAADKFKSGKLKFAANATAVAIKSGTAATAKFTEGVAVFIRSTGGLMAEAALGGQKFTYQSY